MISKHPQTEAPGMEREWCSENRKEGEPGEIAVRVRKSQNFKKALPQREQRPGHDEVIPFQT